MIREVSTDEYLDRQGRMLRARGKVDGQVDTDAVRRILAEVVPIELIPGARYRFRVLGGVPQWRRIRAVDDRGRHLRLTIPDVEQVAWIEAEGTYRGRGTGAWSASLLFEIPQGLAALADMDIQRIEELDR